MKKKQIRTALISVYDKSVLSTQLIDLLKNLNITIYTTSGTQQWMQTLGYTTISIESITKYPPIFGGRVKTLHPAIFGGILYKNTSQEDLETIKTYNIPCIDLVIVDLYPFESTTELGAKEAACIEKIDIGGVSLLRAAAKNFQEVLVIPDTSYYPMLENLLKKNNGCSTLEERRFYAAHAFRKTMHYDMAIFNYFNQEENIAHFNYSESKHQVLRYGENPHQEGQFFGDLQSIIEPIHGKPMSYNNFLDVDAAIDLIEAFNDTIAFAILKHTNACGVALGNTVKEAYEKALSSNPLSAFGGVLITNHCVDLEAAQCIHTLFFEVLIAPAFSKEALNLLTIKKNRILLLQKKKSNQKKQFKSVLNGVLLQDKDSIVEQPMDIQCVTRCQPTASTLTTLLFANKIAAHLKSNAIVLATKNQLFASSSGQTSRIDALTGAIEKSKRSNITGNSEVVMASDGFFPFPDCVQIAHEAGIRAIIQPGGSIKDQLSIDFCNQHNMIMIFTGKRHFKH